MANKQLFGSSRNQVAPADTRNEAGGKAYSLDSKTALAQYASTGTFNSTFYASAEDQLAKTLKLANEVEPLFLAKTAVYTRKQSFMKDMPALLCAVLAARGETELLKTIFPHVIDNGKMLRNFVQIIRSGQVGRKSFGTSVKKMIQRWFESRTDEQIFKNSIGSDPSLADVVRMTHPRPGSKSREALFRWLIGKDFEKGKDQPKERNLPPIVQAFEKMKAGELDIFEQQIGIPFEMVTSLKLRPEHWKGLTHTMSWTQLRMNLNTLMRHGVFEDSNMVKFVADRLRDEAAIKKARCFPYQLLAAYINIGYDVPEKIRLALQDAMEVATQNIPEFENCENGIYVLPDVSGSMQSASVTGYRKGATSKVTALQVAALVSACVLRKNPTAVVIPFHDVAIRNVRLNSRDSVVTNAQLLASIPSGGTNCSAPLASLNHEKARGDLVIYVSDNQSWVDSGYYKGTGVASEWGFFKKRNPKAKLVCIDVQPSSTTQQNDRPDTLNIGGFSDNVFEVIARFVQGGGDHWTDVIEKLDIEAMATLQQTYDKGASIVTKPKSNGNGRKHSQPKKREKPRRASRHGGKHGRSLSKR